MAKTSLPPGFRFHPTDIELTVYYLKRKLLGKQLRCNAVADIDLYKFAPWDLPEKASLQSRDLEWYFFCTRDRKYASGSRTNRSTEAGYWKATGKDRPIIYNSRTVGMKRTLVFHLGRPPKGDRTDWVMYEYRLVDKEVSASGVKLDACVLCKIFQKSGPGPKIGAQYGAPFNEEDWNDANGELPSFAPSLSHCAPESSHGALNSAGQQLAVSDDGELSPSSETNGDDNADCVRPDIPFDSIHIQQLAGIISCFSTNLLNTVGQDGSLAHLTADYDNEVLSDSEAIFNKLDEVASQSVESITNHCDKCGKRFIPPTLEPLEAEQYLELNDLSFSLARGPDPCSPLLSNDLSDEHPRDLVSIFKQKSPNGICSTANGTIFTVVDSGPTIENHVICSSTANGTTSTAAGSVPTIENHVICSSTANGTTSIIAGSVPTIENHVICSNAANGTTSTTAGAMATIENHVH